MADSLSVFALDNSGTVFALDAVGAVSQLTALPPLNDLGAITSVQKIILSYLYVQYQGDDNVRAFFDAFNAYAQGYLDWFNALNLPIYTQDPVSGSLLDWVAQGLYGISRPALPISRGRPPQGPVNTFSPNQLPVNGFVPSVPSTYTLTDDDTFRRIITWAFFKGDGKIVSPTWIKRRINRFLSGVNGTDPANSIVYNISVAPTGFQAWSITLVDSPEAQIFKLALAAGLLEMPLQITWTVNLT